MKYGILFVFIFLAGCASPPTEPPAWVLDPQSTYPEAQYLTAVGVGDSRRAAENSAAAGLARIFESRIQAVEILSETTTEKRGAIESFDQFSNLRTDVKIGSEQDLLNIQFGEAFTDKKGRVHAVATLPRAETATVYQQRIGELSADIFLLIRLSDKAVDPVEKYAFRRAAVRKALENDRLLDQLHIINPRARDTLSLHYDPQALYTQTAAAAHNVTFSVQFSGDGVETIREALTSMGFSENAAAVLRFSGSASFKKTDLRRDPLMFVRYRYTLETRTHNDRLVLTFNGNHREGHINFTEAAARARRALRTEIKRRIPQEVGDYLDRLASAE